MNRIITTALGLTSLAGVGLLAGWSNGLGSYNQRETVFETRAAERLYEVDNVHSSLVFSMSPWFWMPTIPPSSNG